MVDINLNVNFNNKGEDLMASVQEIKVAIQDLQDSVSQGLDAIAVKITDLKAQITAGAVATPMDLEEILTMVNSAKSSLVSKESSTQALKQ